mmetsp:Transcript_18772/g.30860  ORF Transcript_18772/g.30860 Transcript_18772/m.30860 type:complete len:231 (-) Transcript_18772:740-1432(-)
MTTDRAVRYGLLVAGEPSLQLGHDGDAGGKDDFGCKCDFVSSRRGDGVLEPLLYKAVNYAVSSAAADDCVGAVDEVHVDVVPHTARKLVPIECQRVGAGDQIDRDDKVLGYTRRHFVPEPLSGVNVFDIFGDRGVGGKHWHHIENIGLGTRIVGSAEVDTAICNKLVNGLVTRAILKWRLVDEYGIISYDGGATGTIRIGQSTHCLVIVIADDSRVEAKLRIGRKGVDDL